MKIRSVFREIYKSYFLLILPIAVLQLLLALLAKVFPDNMLLYMSVDVNSLAFITFLYILITFRRNHNLFAQFGVPRTQAFYAYLGFLPIALLIALIRLAAVSVSEVAVSLTGGAALSEFSSPHTAETLLRLGLSAFFKALRYVGGGYAVGAVLYHFPKKFGWLMLPVSAAFLYAYFMLAMLYGEGGSLPSSLFTVLIFYEDTAFPILHMIARDLSAAVIYLSVGRLLMRGAPAKA